jgi:hypothetical protein
LFCKLSVSQNIGIGTINPNPSVGLHIDLKDKGLLTSKISIVQSSYFKSNQRFVGI